MENKESLKYNKLIPIKMSSTALLELCILYFLKEADVPTYGTQILGYIDETLGTAWGPSHSNLYILLSDMEAAQHIKSVYSDKKRIFYVITPSGSRILEDKLREYYETLLASKNFFDNLISTFYGNGVMT